MKICRPICRAAVWMFSLASAVSETFGLTRMPIVASFGTSSPRNCRHFESSALVDITTPVTLRLGRLRLAITPVFRMTSLLKKTIGTVVVAAAAASTTGGAAGRSDHGDAAVEQIGRQSRQ